VGILSAKDNTEKKTSEEREHSNKREKEKARGKGEKDNRKEDQPKKAWKGQKTRGNKRDICFSGCSAFSS
jgi:hypothetical protein